MGWFTVVSYFAAALIAALWATYLNQMEEKRACRFWSLLCLLMMLLGINKQLDLQTLLSEIGRQVAIAQGWYENRRVVQFSFIVLFALTAATAFGWATRVHRDLFGRFPLAFWGLLSLLVFVIIRAAAFHHFDQLINYDIHGIKMNWVFELVGIYTIILAGLKEIFFIRFETQR